MTAGPPEFSPRVAAAVPVCNDVVLGRGTRAYMTARGANYVRVGGSWIAILLCTLAVSLLTAAPAQAEDCVADFGGIIDGTVVNPAPSQIQIDGNCTIRNFVGSNPLLSNISFLTQPGQTNERWLVIFDNVRHT